MTTDAQFGDTQTPKDRIKGDLKTVLTDMDEYLRATASQTGEKIGAIRERITPVRRCLYWGNSACRNVGPS